MTTSSSPALRAQPRTEAEALRAIWDRRSQATRSNAACLDRAQRLIQGWARISRLLASFGQRPEEGARAMFLTEARGMLRHAKVARLSSTMGARLP